MEGLLGALEQQQSSVNSSVAQISAASSAGARRMVDEITSAADVRIVQMTERAAADLTTTFGELREATALATAAHADVQRAGAEAQGVAVALVREAERIMGDANSVRRDAVAHAQHARALVDEVRAMSEALREAAREVSRQTALVTTTIAEQTALQVRQQKTIEQLESTMPKLFETYGTSIQKQAESLALSWQKQAESVRQVMDGVGGDFASGVQDLSDAVDRLEKSLGQKRLSP
jgi:alanyl-tRNA synthetase